MAQLQLEKQYSFDEYLGLEEQSEWRNEYKNGKFLSLEYTTITKARIKMNMLQYIHQNTDKEKLHTHITNVKVYLRLHNICRYPDLFLLNEEHSFYDNKKKTVVLNPYLILEVVSEELSTKNYIKRFDEYKSLATFEEYVLVEQDKPQVTVYTKEIDGTWTSKITTDLQKSIQLRALNIEMPMQRIYRKIKFE